jgi:hypothetical protein
MTPVVRVLATAAMLAVPVTACGSSSLIDTLPTRQSGGPLALPSAGGQPAFSVDGGYFSAGQTSTFGIFLINKAADPVTLVSGSLIPVSGHPAGRLVVLRAGIKLGIPAGSHGFPVAGLPTRPFRGARLAHGLNTVIFGIAGDRPGRFYMVAGIVVRYRYHGQLYAVNAWSASVLCTVRNWRTAQENPACNRAEQIDRRATEHMAGV